jgi:hypothetical protein
MFGKDYAYLTKCNETFSWWWYENQACLYKTLCLGMEFSQNAILVIWVFRYYDETNLFPGARLRNMTQVLSCLELRTCKFPPLLLVSLTNLRRHQFDNPFEWRLGCCHFRPNFKSQIRIRFRPSKFCSVTTLIPASKPMMTSYNASVVKVYTTIPM